MTAPIAVLLFGRTGQVGGALLSAAAARGGFVVRALGRDEADFSDPESVRASVMDADAADIVVNAAAYTNVVKAEADDDLAQTVNGASVAALAGACGVRGIPLVHLSTDYVFDGKKAAPYVEGDPPHPLNVYGRSKLAGEEAIRAILDRHVILRTSWVYGTEGANFVNTMLRHGAEQDEIRVVDDQHGAPTSAGDIADAILANCRGDCARHGTGTVRHLSLCRARRNHLAEICRRNLHVGRTLAEAKAARRSHRHARGAGRGTAAFELTLRLRKDRARLRCDTARVAGVAQGRHG